MRPLGSRGGGAKISVYPLHGSSVLDHSNSAFLFTFVCLEMDIPCKWTNGNILVNDDETLEKLAIKITRNDVVFFFCQSISFPLSITLKVVNI